MADKKSKDRLKKLADVIRGMRPADESLEDDVYSSKGKKKKKKKKKPWEDFDIDSYMAPAEKKFGKYRY